MTEHKEVLNQADAWSQGGLGVALATVTSTWGSALRPAGSQLAVNEKGAFVGSVSGGCIEGAVVQESLDTIRDGKPRRLKYGVSNERAWEVGLSCGGEIEIFVEPLEQAGARADVFGELRRALQADRLVVLATV